jgi:hypothetical protein
MRVLSCSAEFCPFATRFSVAVSHVSTSSLANLSLVAQCTPGARVQEFRRLVCRSDIFSGRDLASGIRVGALRWADDLRSQSS